MTTNNDLNVGLARLIGYSVKGEWWYDGHKQEAPPFYRSLDALFAPGGPVEYAWNKGMAVELSNWTQGWLATVGQDARGNQMRPTAAEALAAALHEAFMKEQGQ